MSGDTHPDSSTGATTGLISHLTEQLGDDKAWRSALDALKRGDFSLHLAVLTKPFLGPLLNGIKAIESRFSRVRGTPDGVIHPQRRRRCQKARRPCRRRIPGRPGPQLPDDPGLPGKIRARFSQQIQAREDKLWDDHAESRYGPLVNVQHPRRLPGLPFPKRDRRGWAVLTVRRCES